MIKKKKFELNKILNDKISGSSEILANLNRFLISVQSNKILFSKSIEEAEKRLSHFSAISNYLKKVTSYLKKNDPDQLKNYLASFQEDEELKYQQIFNKVFKKLSGANTLLTISKSGTLLEVFKLWHNKNKKLKIIITESRPASEGKLMAKKLLRLGLKVELITDAMSAQYVPKSDAVIIGADSILKNGNVINKSGSNNMAFLANKYKKPFYVLATKSKMRNRKASSIKEESPEQLWNFTHPKLKITNIPFEEVDQKLITGIITE